ncbi:MAG: SDR family NAD(P)-dependent oxidoreductase, partial [Chitinivibrionales bacterium]|nr:SDR family NAD(P)-dependent oxidoreductase [Chitinivibrionales bacterium]
DLGRYVHEEAEKSALREPPTAKRYKIAGANDNGKAKLAGKPKDIRDENALPAIVASLKALLAEELQMEMSEINDKMQFVDIGLDSITGVTWIRKINEKYKIAIEATKIYSWPTLEQLGQYVLGVLISNEKMDHDTISLDPRQYSRKSTPPPTKSTLQSRRLISWRNNKRLYGKSSLNEYSKEPIAVVGMAGKFPMARNLDEYWDNLSAGKNCISEIPRSRWNFEQWYQAGKATPGKTNCKWMGALEDCDLFDAMFFNISPAEAECMDPQQRLFLQACWHGIEHAGYNPKLLSGSKCGVYVGCAAGDYLFLSRKHMLSAHGFTGGATSILAARIAYFLNLNGPCLSIDTACSSSLVAIANACESLRAGTSDWALAGGVCVMATPQMHIRASQTGMLSPDGQCYTFDNKANGFVPGEGVGVVVLKRLADALKDNDLILGKIQGWGINQDGKTNGITAPNAEMQTRLEQEVYDNYSIDPTGIQLIEAHGTGTKLGDPIEVSALKEAFKKYTTKMNYCALTSVKSNIGHCLTAAGISGFIKILLAIKNKKIPPTINYQKLNDHISLEESPFYINDRLRDWNCNEDRCAAISSFGFSGTNAHVVIAEYNESSSIRRKNPVVKLNEMVMVPLSAKTQKELVKKAIDLQSFIKNGKENIDLTVLAYTLQVGREPMDKRLGVMAESLADLNSKLIAFINGKEKIDGVYLGRAKSSKEEMSLIHDDPELHETILNQWIEKRKLSKLMDLWVKGLEINWKKLYGVNIPARMHLPLYPFAEERYWIESGHYMLSEEPHLKDEVGHPLLHRNLSNFGVQRYLSRFTSDDCNIEKSTFTGLCMLIPATCIELACAAIINAGRSDMKTTTIAMKDGEWEDSASIDDTTKILTELSINDEGNIEYIIKMQKETDEVVRHRGTAVCVDGNTTEYADIEAVKMEMHPGTVDLEQYIGSLKARGVEGGILRHTIKEFLCGEDQVVAAMELPKSMKHNDGYYIHPNILQSAFHICHKLLPENAFSSTSPVCPKSYESAQYNCATSEKMYAWISSDKSRASENGTPLMDLILCDFNGKICASINGIEFTRGRQSSSTMSISQYGVQDNVSYVPKWEKAALSNFNDSINHSSILIVCSGGSYGFEKTIQDYYRDRGIEHITFLRMGDKSEKISENVWVCNIYDSDWYKSYPIKLDKVDAVYFCAITDDSSGLTTKNKLINCQESNEIQFLRLFKYLNESGSIAEYVDTYIITCNTTTLGSSRNNPWGAAVTGLGYSLAQGNYRFLVRNIDLSAKDLATQGKRINTLAAVLNEPYSDRGEQIKIEGGIRYRRVFYSLRWAQNETGAIKQDGAYLILGGSGTIGTIITRHLLKKYHATVIWIGRSSKESEKVSKALAAFEVFGSRLHYVQADATDIDSMNNAVKSIKERGI